MKSIRTSASNIYAVLGLTLSIGVLTACNDKKASTDNVLRLSMLADAKTFDPPFTEDLYTFEAQGQVYEGLLQYSYLKRPHQVEPLLAESMPEISKDQLTYTFKIKKGVRFDDHPAFAGGKGREVKAKDFVYSFLRIADPKLATTGFWIFDKHIVGLNEWRQAQEKAPSVNYEAPVEGIKALDDYTLQIKLTSKYPQLEFIMAMPMTFVVAREVVEKTGKDFVHTPVGTGPYRLVSWQRNAKLVYERNPNWRGEAYPTEGEEEDKANGNLADAGKQMPFVDHVELLPLVEEQPRWLNFVGGQTDIVLLPKDFFKTAFNAGTFDLAPDLKAKGVVSHRFPQPEVTYIGFNMEDPVIKKGGPNLRKALSLAIDHDKDLALFYNNSGVMAQSPIPPGIAGYDAAFKNPYKKFDLALAKEYMAKSGFPNGLTLTYESTQGTDYRQMAEKYQKEFAAINVKLNVNVNQFSELMEKQNKKTAQMWGIAWIADYPDVENFLQLLYGPNKAPSPNSSNFDDPKFNSLFEKVRAMQDSPERHAAIHQMQEIFVEQLPWIVGVHRVQYYLSQGRVKNYKADYMGPHMSAKYMRLDLGPKK